jgi:hypothetical protein
MRTLHRIVVASSVLGLLAASSLLGPDVDETTSVNNDAGGNVRIAKVAKGSGTVNSASGATSSGLVTGDFVDMFLIYVSNPAQFSITVQQPTSFDSQLFLFKVGNDSSGLPTFAEPIFANDDAVTNAAGGYSKIVLPAGTAVSVGTYAVAIAPKGVRPYSYSDGGQTGGPGTRTPFDMFTTQVTGLQTPVSLTAKLRAWFGSPLATGPYAISFTGTSLIPLGVGQGRCGDVFSGSCFATHTAPACDDEACCRLVCAVDPYCCTSSWDANCVAVAEQTCTSCSQPQQSCPGDLNGDGQIDGADLGAMLVGWGQCN